VREIVDGVLDPYAATDRKRLHVSGPDIRVNPRTALILSMALHELATNAAKYGALSNGAGEIFVDWTPADHNNLRLRWREKGGPPVRPAERKGFGSKLIEDAFASQIGGSATLSFEPSGLVCTLECARE
jgi:two-component sensor histidine kinase